MLSVSEALGYILDDAASLAEEELSLADIVGRVAVEPLRARMTQPPFAASAMDGYAVRFADAGKEATLNLIGEAPAGVPFSGMVGAGEAVRIFTGGVVPDGADHIVVQEDVTRQGDQIVIEQEQPTPRHIRKAGIDFAEGDMLVEAGTVLNEMHGSILAAANIGTVNVVRRPKVALFSNGNELRGPGDQLHPGEIINSNHYALTAMVRRWGGEPVYLGCARDDEKEIERFFVKATGVEIGADVIVPIGGASVGDFDFVKSAFDRAGGALTFSKIAVRPGKPTWFGRLDPARVIGLPGNPASALVTAALFLQPLVRALGGQGAQEIGFQQGVLGRDLPANGARESFLRGSATATGNDKMIVTPVVNQDSSLLSPFLTADVLIRRQNEAPATAAGEAIEFVRLR